MSIPARYKLTYNELGQHWGYWWHDLNEKLFDHTEIEIVTWKGVYKLTIFPTHRHCQLEDFHLERNQFDATVRGPIKRYPIRLYGYRHGKVFNPVKKRWDKHCESINKDIIGWINAQLPQPTRYKLIKTTTNEYRWENLNDKDRDDDGKMIEIETWKGVYKLRTFPPFASTRYDFIRFNYYNNICALPFYVYYIRSTGVDKIYHPIQRNCIFDRGQETIQLLNKDIIEWIEAQPPQPDWEGVAKDRKEVEQVFMEM